MGTSIFLLLLGLLMLVAGGEFLVKSAVAFAQKLNVAPFLIGITVVSFGTSAPELMVSIQAAIGGASGIAIGNVIGSNIANIGLVLGLTAIVKPILIEKKKYILSWWIMLISTLLFIGLVYDGTISSFDGLIFIIGLTVFILLSIKIIKNEEIEEKSEGDMHFVKSFIFFILGSAGLYFGSDFFVNNSIYIAKEFGVSEFIIGITIVAFGTSLPELVTSIVAAVRNQNGISIGNLIGSNIFNVFAVLGITALIKPLQMHATSSDLTMMGLLVMLSFALIMGLYLTTKKISRFKGLVLVIGYLIYIGITIFI